MEQTRQKLNGAQTAWVVFQLSGNFIKVGQVLTLNPLKLFVSAAKIGFHQQGVLNLCWVNI